MTGIGLLGFGTVGQGIYRVLREREKGITKILGSPCQVQRILVQDLRKKRDTEAPSRLFTLNPQDILEDDTIGVVVEVTGDLSFSYDFILKAFEKGKHVVTANKAVVSRYYEELSEKAQEHGVFFLYEASVAAGVPVLKALKDQIPLSPVEEVGGILNGTCNYILTRMSEESLEYEAVLEEAKGMGYAESDPSADVEGTDTARKLRILATLAFGGSVKEEDILKEGISAVTALDVRLLKTLGRKVKLVGEAKEKEGAFTAWVYPRAVPMDSAFHHVEGADNLIALKSAHAGPLKFQGPGAGMLSTASGVLTDVLDCILGTQRKENPLGKRSLMCRNENLEGVFYVRLSSGADKASFPEDAIARVLLAENEAICFLTEKMNLMKLRALVEKHPKQSYAMIHMA